MMKHSLNGLGKVFCFTLKQQMKAKGYRSMTIVVLLLCLLLPAGLMAAAEQIGSDSDRPEISEGSEEFESFLANTFYTVDLTDGKPVDFSVLGQLFGDQLPDVEYISCQDAEEALDLGRQNPFSLVLILDQTVSGRRIRVVTPEESLLPESSADQLTELLNQASAVFALQKSGLSAEQLAAIAEPVSVTNLDTAAGEWENQEDMVLFILKLVLPFVNIMLLYFLVLFYGQNAANQVMMEKTSKLMDTFLVSVKPGAMITGKVLAVVLASIIQFALWMAALAGSFAAGCVLVRTINPQSQMGLVLFLENLGQFTGAFSVPGVVAALALICAGLLLYCAIASIGGSLAGKPEDLSATNVLFVMILVISFFCTLYSGGIEGIGSGSVEASQWMNWVPFTAILITPSRVLLGDVSIAEGIGSLAVVVGTSGIIMAVAGKVYQMMSFFRGEPPKPGQLIKMLRG